MRSMSEYAVARLEDIDELSDGREPWRPVRHHFGITSFGINAWTGREAGDRIINEHDEDGEDEELYFVHSGRARFELDGERVEAPAGTFVFARPGVKRTAFAEEPGTTILVAGARPGQVYKPTGWELWAPVGRALPGGAVRRSGRPGSGPGRGAPAVPRARSTTSPAARASPGARPTRSSICGSRSKSRTGFGRTWRRTQTSILSATSRSSRRSSTAEAREHSQVGSRPAILVSQPANACMSRICLPASASPIMCRDARAVVDRVNRLAEGGAGQLELRVVGDLARQAGERAAPHPQCDPRVRPDVVNPSRDRLRPLLGQCGRPEHDQEGRVATPHDADDLLARLPALASACGQDAVTAGRRESEHRPHQIAEPPAVLGGLKQAPVVHILMSRPLSDLLGRRPCGYLRHRPQPDRSEARLRCSWPSPTARRLREAALRPKRYWPRRTAKARRSGPSAAAGELPRAQVPPVLQVYVGRRPVPSDRPRQPAERERQNPNRALTRPPQVPSATARELTERNYSDCDRAGGRARCSRPTSKRNGSPRPPLR